MVIHKGIPFRSSMVLEKKKTQLEKKTQEHHHPKHTGTEQENRHAPMQKSKQTTQKESHGTGPEDKQDGTEATKKESQLLVVLFPHRFLGSGARWRIGLSQWRLHPIVTGRRFWAVFLSELDWPFVWTVTDVLGP